MQAVEDGRGDQGGGRGDGNRWMRYILELKLTQGNVKLEEEGVGDGSVRTPGINPKFLAGATQ